MKDKQILVVKDDDSSDVLGVILIDDTITEDEIEAAFRNVKQSLPGEWQVSDLFEALYDLDAHCQELPSITVLA